jgi:ABC-2 type transport system ATP-binding protein
VSEDGGREEVISVSGLVKTFGTTRALDGLDLSVRAGEVHGFLGPNGAGKSTTLRIVLGLIRKNDGVVRLFGGDPWAEAASLHRRLAYVPGDVSLWPNLSGGQVIDLLLRMRGAPADHPWRAEMIDRFELDPTKKGRAYSKGNRQKVALVAALASDVELLLLDEPTTGLDPLMEEVFRDCITEERDAGRTVLLSSHVLSEVEALCDRVSIVRAGRTVETGTLAELRHLTATSVDAVLSRPVGPGILSAMSGLLVEGNHVRGLVPSGQLGAVLEVLGGYGIESLVSQPPTLEQLFLRHYDTGLPTTERQAPSS